MPQPTAISCLVAARRAAAPAPVAGGGATRPALLRRLGAAVAERQPLERLAARSPGGHARKVELAEAIDTMADELRASYRGPSTRAPLWRSADGSQAA